MSTVKNIFAELDNMMLVDKHHFLRRLKVSKNDEQKRANILANLERQLPVVKAKLQQRIDSIDTAKIEFPDNLPVSNERQVILDLIQNNQVVIIAGETGSGKTTQLPKMCLQLGLGIKGMIGHTQPRRVAARAVANRIAEELHSELGSIVGYKVRFTDNVAENSLIKVMTDGILLAEIQNDRYLNQYDTLIIDEAHERSLNNDFILGYLKQLLAKRPDLKVIITSATIDVERFAKHFDNAPILTVSGRTYPVEVLYRPLVETENPDLTQSILDAVYELRSFGRGDILIFLNGEREIRDLTDTLNKQQLRHTEILPLYARLSNLEQNKIFHPGNLDRIILATNVAETSLTVPGIKYVIDPGTARISRYSYRTKVQRLPIEAISQASANQRKGRCGRVSDGICIRLYSEDDFNSRPEFTDPEILRTNLASVILQMLNLGLRNIQDFPFIDSPEYKNIQDGNRLLQELGAVVQNKQQEYSLTNIGKSLSRLPLDPRFARMILAAEQYNCVYEVAVITAALSIQDPRERPQDKKQSADDKHRRFEDKDSDFLSLMNLWRYLQENQHELSRNKFKNLCQQNYLNYLRVREWQDIVLQIRTEVRSMGLKINSEPATYQEIHLALLTGLLSHIGMKEAEKHQYLGARNARFAIFPNSALFKKQPKWVASAELVETSKLWARTVAKIEPEWIEGLAGHLIKKSYTEPHWMRSRGAVIATEKVTLYGLPIVAGRNVEYSKIDPELCREIFIQSALIEGDWQTKHTFFKQNQAAIREVEKLEDKTRRRDILVDEKTLFDFYAQYIPLDIVSVKHFDSWWNKEKHKNPDLLNFEKSFLIRNESAIKVADYPNFWQQNNLKFRLSYKFEPGAEYDGVTLHIPITLLNQIEISGFEWQIPALRTELIISLLKGLPKSKRKNFVPVPNYADAFLARVEPFNKPLIEALSSELFKMTGVKIEPDEWQLSQLANNLLINFCVEDSQGKVIAISKNLDELKTKLQGQVQETLALAVDDEVQVTGRLEWDFGELSQCYTQKQKGLLLKAYPAIVDEKKSVAIKLYETEAEQTKAMHDGLRRLVLLNVPSPIKYLHEKLPNKSKLGLYFAPFGKVLDLIDDCIAAAADKLINDFGGFVWNEQDFMQLKDYVRANLNQETVNIASQIEQLLTQHFHLVKRLKGGIDLSISLSLADIKQQLNGLIYSGFVLNSGCARLADIGRYLQAIDKRLDKLFIDPNRDRINMHKIEQVQQAYKSFIAKLPKSQPLTEEVLAIPYMIEELRISLFAQQIGTAYPISEKRIINLIEDLSKSYI